MQPSCKYPVLGRGKYAQLSNVNDCARNLLRSPVKETPQNMVALDVMFWNVTFIVQRKEPSCRLSVTPRLRVQHLL